MSNFYQQFFSNEIKFQDSGSPRSIVMTGQLYSHPLVAPSSTSEARESSRHLTSKEYSISEARTIKFVSGVILKSR